MTNQLSSLSVDVIIKVFLGLTPLYVKLSPIEGLKVITWALQSNLKDGIKIMH